MKHFLTVFLFLCSISLSYSQGTIQFSYTVSTVGSTSTIMVYVENAVASTENMTSYTMNIYHDNTESTITNFDVSPTDGLGWLSLPSFTIHNTASNAAIPITHTGFANINVLDFFGLGSLFGQPPTHILTITADNSPGSNPDGEFYLSSSSEGHPEQVYNDNGMPIPMAYPIVIVANIPSPKIAGASTYCAGTGGVSLDAGAGFASYSWSPGGETTQTITATAGTYTVTVTDGTGATGSSDPFILTENPAPSPSISGSTDYCQGTSGVNLDAGAGFSSYSWSPNGEITQTITATAETYTVSVTNANGCTGISPHVIVSEFDGVAPIPTVSPLPTLSDPASVSLTAPTATDNCVGLITGTTTSPMTITTPGTTIVTWTYDDGNGNSVDQQQTVIITPPSGPSFTAIGIDESCDVDDDGSIQVTASGGSGNYDFSADNGANWITGTSNVYTFLGLDGGSYELLVRDSNNPTSVSASQTIIIGNGAQPDFTTSTMDASCTENQDGSIDVNAIGAAPFTFSLDGGTFSGSGTMQTYSNLAANDYLIQVQDINGCLSEVKTVTTGANLPPDFTVSVSHESAPSANDGAIMVTVNSGTPAFLFSLDAGDTYLSSASNSYTFTGLTIGIYDIQVQDANGCESSRLPALVSGANFCPPSSLIDDLYEKNPGDAGKNARFVCQDQIPNTLYEIKGLTAGQSFYFDWEVSGLHGKDPGYRPTMDGLAPATDGSVNGSTIPVSSNGIHINTYDGTIFGLESETFGHRRISFGVIPYLINVDNETCPGNPVEWRVYIYPRPEMELDNANTPGVGIILNSGDDPSGLISNEQTSNLREKSGILLYDLHIAPNADIAELTNGLDLTDIGLMADNRVDKEFDAIDLGITSLTNTSNGAVTITIEVTPTYDGDHPQSADIDPIDNPKGLCAGEMQTIDLTILPPSQNRVRNSIDINGQDILFRLYPVPSHDHLFLQASKTLEQDQAFEVINLLGQQLQSGTIEAGQHRLKIFTENLAEGVYMVRFLNPTGRDVVIKFEKR